MVDEQQVLEFEVEERKRQEALANAYWNGHEANEADRIKAQLIDQAELDNYGYDKIFFLPYNPMGGHTDQATQAAYKQIASKLNFSIIPYQYNGNRLDKLDIEKQKIYWEKHGKREVLWAGRVLKKQPSGAGGGEQNSVDYKPAGIPSPSPSSADAPAVWEPGPKTVK